MSFRQDIQRIAGNARALEQRMLAASRVVIEDFGDELVENVMKPQAPWQDRPDDERPAGLPHARELLDSVPVHPATLEGGGAIALIQGATYGIHLETAHGGKYNIIQDTVATYGPVLTQRLQEEVWT